MTLGQRIQELRKGLGLSQEELGERMGVSRQAISKWEGDQTIPELDNLIALSRLFGLTVGQLLGYGESIHGKVGKLSGTVGAGTLGPAGQDVRFRLTDDEALSVTLPVAYDGALSDEVTDGSAVVLTGSLGKDGAFIATDVALEA